jgi:phytoene synthase
MREAIMRYGHDLEASYQLCEYMHRRYGRTYYLATRLLPPWKRRHVHALYGFTRYTDELVDAMNGDSTEQRRVLLNQWRMRFAAAIGGELVDDPVLPAVLNTIRLFDLDLRDFAAFFRAMEMDLSVTEYDTYDDLLGYMDGSAAAIGSMMLPILGAHDLDEAREPARQLGLAFQLTNFIRDVAEDLDRGRIYLPGKDLADFGVTPLDLRDRVATGPIKALIMFEAERARKHYVKAAPGIPMLDPSSQRCIRTAFRLYGEILHEVAKADFDVFRRRATVPRRMRLAIAGTSLLTPVGRPVRAPNV